MSRLATVGLGLSALWLCGCGTGLYFGTSSAPSTASECTGNHGPESVEVDGFCIDQTEVSEKQYAEFLASNQPVAAQPVDCAWNQYFEPQAFYSEVPRAAAEPERQDYPVTEVDFCDARAYCEWAGKRLCGKRDGGSLPLERDDLAGESEWFQACSAAGTLTYPYGQEFQPEACAVNKDLYEVGTQLGCEGGFAGIFDLIGNVWEWEDSCFEDASTAPDAVICSRRGGALTVEPIDWTCAERGDPSPRLTRQVDMGIRCCSDAVN